MTDDYKYEVAFSFLQQDESLAQALNDLLQDRMSTFIYSERQLELAGKDGELLLKKVFGSEARIVVILYRKEWGTTPWTRIEQDAIRDRGHDHGYDFCLLIPLDEPQTKPEWYPKYRIWIGLRRWGNDAAAAVIEDRVHEAGGMTREESLADRKARLERQVKAAEKRKNFLESENAVGPANTEAQRLLEEIEQTASSLSTNDFPLKVKREMEVISVKSYGFDLQVYWRQRYANVIRDSCLYVHLLKLDRQHHFEPKFRELKKLEFHFSLNESEEYGWDLTQGNKKFFSTKELTDFVLRMLLDKIADFSLKKSD
jgi:hypothetical protein